MIHAAIELSFGFTIAGCLAVIVPAIGLAVRTLADD